MSSDPGQDDAAMARRGLVMVISSPSGAGKTTISRNLLQLSRGLDLSISVTTRPQRPSEVNGVHYRFVDVATFAQMRERGELLEWAEVHGNLYGTPAAPVEKALAAGRDILFDIDWQGTRQVRERLPDDVVTVFILPPSAGELRARLERRAEDSAEVIGRRLENAREELAHWREYDYVVLNRIVEEAVGQVRAILEAERCRRQRLAGIDALVADITDRL